MQADGQIYVLRPTVSVFRSESSYGSTLQGILTKEVWTVGEELREDRENPAMLAHDGFDERGYPLE